MLYHLFSAVAIVLIFIVAVLIGINFERIRLYKLLRLHAPEHSIIMRLKHLCIEQHIDFKDLLNLKDFPEMDASECLDYIAEYFLQSNYQRHQNPNKQHTLILIYLLSYYSPIFQDEVSENLSEDSPYQILKKVHEYDSQV